MSVTEMVGWELLYKHIEKDIKTETDIIVAITHWYLINQAGFRCLGTGDEKTLRDNEASNSTEILPENWNENSTAYALRYVHEQKVYILLGTVANDTIILNLLNGEPLKVTNTALHIKDTVKTLQGNLLTLVPDVRNVLSRLKRELLEPVVAFDSNTKSSETQTTTPEPPRLRGIPDPDILPNTTPDVLRVQPRIIDPLRDIGRGDLDPLGRGGGGMLFNPPFNNPNQPNILPRGPDRNPPGVIPGARFDPFGPIDPFNNPHRPNPRPDHLPPPGFEDMFM
ncbi:proteasome inhibitor PI31 subunit-like [Sitodiplosis mosellana]|uniref:proteasome inhibitor PI31 subunit-like n=1 Tax=Sitodiplosis mosellana TaxID=263140 RepID=UPI00244424CE|nr:proteasome inhibitor PI31 subunit-like [Sitodiplosis mosellana]